jgi:ABC-type lipoprotein export system ATPase subunit
VIELTDLTFAYSVADPIFAGLDHRFEPGTSTALVGRSGSGKSTLLYLIGLMLSPTSGSIAIDGIAADALADWQRAEMRARLMGFVFQDALLDPARSIIDNVLEGALYNDVAGGDTREEALALLSRFGVTVDSERRPGQLSGGQAQRVALCRALLGEPAIVLADEPTGNLDDMSADIVWDALLGYAAAGATVVIATHDRQRAALCTSIVEVGHADPN